MKITVIGKNNNNAEYNNVSTQGATIQIPLSNLVTQ